MCNSFRPLKGILFLFETGVYDFIINLNFAFPSPQGDSFFIRLPYGKIKRIKTSGVSVPSRGFFFYSFFFFIFFSTLKSSLVSVPSRGFFFYSIISGLCDNHRLQICKEDGFRPLKGILFLFSIMIPL